MRVLIEKFVCFPMPAGVGRHCSGVPFFIECRLSLPMSFSPTPRITEMSTQSMLMRLIAPLAIAISVAGVSSTAEAATYKAYCAPTGLCFYKDTQGYTNNRTYFYLTFNGSKVTYYNIVYREPGGRVVTDVIVTRPGSNGSVLRSLAGTPGLLYTVKIQACNGIPNTPLASILNKCGIWYTPQ